MAEAPNSRLALAGAVEVRHMRVRGHDEAPQGARELQLLAAAARLDALRLQGDDRLVEAAALQVLAHEAVAEALPQGERPQAPNRPPQRQRLLWRPIAYSPIELQG